MSPLRLFIYGELPEHFTQKLMNTEKYYIMDHKRGWRYYKRQQAIVIDNFEEQPYFLIRMVFNWITKKGMYYDPEKNDLIILSKYPPSHFEGIEDILKKLDFSIRIPNDSDTGSQTYHDMKRLLHEIQKMPKKRIDTEREEKKDLMGKTFDDLLEQRGRSGAFIVSKTEKAAQSFIDCIVPKPKMVHLLNCGTRTPKWRRRYTASPIDCRYHLLVLQKENIITKSMRKEVCNTMELWSRPFIWERDKQHKPLLVVVPDQPEKFFKFTPNEKEFFDTELFTINVERKSDLIN